MYLNILVDSFSESSCYFFIEFLVFFVLVPKVGYVNEMLREIRQGLQKCNFYL